MREVLSWAVHECDPLPLHPCMGAAHPLIKPECTGTVPLLRVPQHVASPYTGIGPVHVFKHVFQIALRIAWSRLAPTIYVIVKFAASACDIKHVR